MTIMQAMAPRQMSMLQPAWCTEHRVNAEHAWTTPLPCPSNELPIGRSQSTHYLFVMQSIHRAGLPARPRAASVQARAFSSKARVYSPGPSGWKITYYNQDELALLQDECLLSDSYLQGGLQLKPGDSVLDVGANIGLFSCRAAEVGPVCPSQGNLCTCVHPACCYLGCGVVVQACSCCTCDVSSHAHLSATSHASYTPLQHTAGGPQRAGSSPGAPASSALGCCTEHLLAQAVGARPGGWTCLPAAVAACLLATQPCAGVPKPNHTKMGVPQTSPHTCINLRFPARRHASLRWCRRLWGRRVGGARWSSWGTAGG